MPDLGEWVGIAQLLAQITVLLGFPLVIIRYFRTTRKEARDREYGTYNALDDKYLAFQQLCLEHPRLDIGDVPLAAPPALTADEQTQELIAFTILGSVFERAYLMYQDQRPSVRIRQWLGWHEYIESYCRRRNFRDAWTVTGRTFDVRFQQYMEGVIRGTFSSAAGQPSSEPAPASEDDVRS